MKSLTLRYFLAIFLLSKDFLYQQVEQTLIHDSGQGAHPSIVQVSTNVFAVAYHGTNGKGIIKTFTIASDGSTITENQELQHDGSKAKYNSLIQVDSDTYLLAYEGGSNDGFIKTFTIPSTGNSITQVTSVEHDNAYGKHNSLVQVDSDTYALAYESSNDDGHVATFTVSSDGTTLTEVGSVEYTTDDGENNAFVQVDSDTYALLYHGDNNGGIITTFTIASNGSITDLGTAVQTSGSGEGSGMVQVDSDTYLALAGDYAYTFTISSNGSSIAQVASLQFTSNGTHGEESFDICQVDSDTYLIAYKDSGKDAWLTTLDVSSDGSTITKVDENEHDTNNCGEFSLAKLDSDTFVLAYSRENNTGILKTFAVSSEGTLPVELTSFELLETRNDGITLQWVTESEINNLGFNLDRKAPITDWSQIASYITHPELQGQGSVSHQTIYTFTDNTVQENESYDYRLSDVDYDGNVKYHSLQLMGVSSTNIPEQFVLDPNYPNPFNPTTKIHYGIPSESKVLLTIFDMLGKEVIRLIDENQDAGYRTIAWNGTDAMGRNVGAGMYFYFLKAGDFRQTRKMILLK